MACGNPGNPKRRGVAVKSLRTAIRDMLREIPIDEGGGRSVSKAYLMAYLIRRYDRQMEPRIRILSACMMRCGVTAA